MDRINISNKKSNIKIIRKGKEITRNKIFKEKERYHKEQAKLPFEEKIKILVKLQKIAEGITGKKGLVWKIK
ncbi:MAG TPA: hypothetical protein PLT82_01240 [Candidatus Hydrogenedens sp.]|nr:hypothetical protein [Candidatus Hydrogenedens sp.]HOK09949.1 hypothetical protein [Candidatus Hydrogenedens sp.]HOL19670.1 hypothetical protein [Candidatus Hydrogenedens sp.]HPP57736.1 hypothetical protein [Candidatus Hydrogenedens sp.]